MSNIYKAQMRANVDVDKIIHDLVRSGGDIDIEYLLLQLTGRHAVSEGSLRKRIDRWIGIYKDGLVVEGGRLKSFVEKEAQK